MNYQTSHHPSLSPSPF